MPVIVLERPFANTETLQLADIHSQSIFYTPLDARFDRLTRLAQKALNVQVAAIALNNDGTLWFKSVQGWNIHELALAASFCARTLTTGQTVIIEDAQLDPDFAEHLLVVGATKFRFYAGWPIRDRTGQAVGTLAAYDRSPRRLSPADVQALRDLADLAQREFLTAELCDAQAQILAKLDIARRSAMIDALTRVWNRRAAEQLLRVAVEQADRDRTALAVCILDVNRFKDINDSAGHPGGDQVLRKVAAILVSSVRDGDAVCRYGGDEFLIIFEKTSREEIEAITERIRQRIGEFPVRTKTGEVNVTVSTGTALRSPGRPMSSEDLIEIADQALYRAKQSSRSSGRSSTTAA
jgi:diguanylate cyclase (GGDEF)-like protein